MAAVEHRFRHNSDEFAHDDAALEKLAARSGKLFGIAYLMCQLFFPGMPADTSCGS